MTTDFHTKTTNLIQINKSFILYTTKQGSPSKSNTGYQYLTTSDREINSFAKTDLYRNDYTKWYNQIFFLPSIGYFLV